MKSINNETPLTFLTVGDFLEILNVTKNKQVSEESKKDTTYVYGLRGIRTLFGVSHPTAQKYKDTFLAPAVSQNGRKLLINKELAVELFNQKNGGCK